MHQRSCLLFKSLKEDCAAITSDPVVLDEINVSHLEQTTDTSNANAVPPNEHSDHTAESCGDPTTLPGIKLPRNDEEWEEANLFFLLNIDMSAPISDINEFTTNLQQVIYNYFRDLYGTVEKDDVDMTSEYNSMSIKELKKELKELKQNNSNDRDIKFVSKLIRYKLKPKAVQSVDPNSKVLAHQLKSKFWKTCKNIFDFAEKILPAFNTSSCFEYFNKILNRVLRLRKFVMPDWIPSLPTPTHPCLTTPPTYAEVTRAINKSKSKASPCPLDQISVIVLKRCPILRTILHKLITECWNLGSIPTRPSRVKTHYLQNRLSENSKDASSNRSNFEIILVRSITV